MAAADMSASSTAVTELAPVSGAKPFPWRFTAPLYVGSSLNPINSAIIATALVPIADGLHVSAGSTAVLVTSLYLASAIAQPTAGKLAEVIGPRRVFLAGILLVLLGGVVGGFGGNMASVGSERVGVTSPSWVTNHRAVLWLSLARARRRVSLVC
jgi:MFS family permease